MFILFWFWFWFCFPVVESGCRRSLEGSNTQMHVYEPCANSHLVRFRFFFWT